MSLQKFESVDWYKSVDIRSHRTMCNQILTWLLDPQGDHGLERRFLDLFFLKLGLNKNMTKPLVLLGHNNVFTSASNTQRILDVVIETKHIFFIIENEMMMSHLEKYGRDELLDKSNWLNDNMRKEKKNMLILLLPSEYVPPLIEKFINNKKSIQTFGFKNIVEIINELLTYELNLKKDKKLYNGLERYALFLQAYVVDVFNEHYLTSRLINLRKILGVS